MIVAEPVQSLWAWLDQRIGIPWSSDFRALGLVRGGCLVACFGYNGFTGRVCFVHNAIDDPSAITRTFVQKIFQYPFEVCGMVQLLAPVVSSNQKAMGVNLRAGFKPLIVLSGAGNGGEDLHILSMKRNECKWLGASSGKKQQSTTAVSADDNQRNT